MSESLLDTFNIVKKLRKAKAVEVLVESKDDVTLSAICNRLDDLHARGILERVKSGRFFYYSICHSKSSRLKSS